ncbi:unnamed protein product, partial [Dovyalis caffra]
QNMKQVLGPSSSWRVGLGKGVVACCLVRDEDLCGKQHEASERACVGGRVRPVRGAKGVGVREREAVENG